MLGRLPAVPGLPIDVSLARFRTGHLLTGKQGVGAVS